MGKSLYQLTLDEQAARAEMEGLFDPEPDEDGVINYDEEKQKAYVASQAASKEKIVYLIRGMHEMELRAALATAEHKSKKEIIERAQKEATRCNNAVENAKKQILFYMLETDKKELLAGPHRLTTIECKGATTVADDAQMSKWDESLYNVKYVPDLNKINFYYKDKPPEKWPHGVTIEPGWRLKIG